jgi:transcriptional regulator with XRE-family HTH domain
MQPEQMRAARAALNWSLDDLAAASGVHRNTISNFETRKYDGEPEKLAAVKHTLEAAGVIFIEENGEAGVRLRRFQVGDLVRFRPQTNTRLNFNIAADEVGTVVAVEPHPPRTGPTYMIMVKFPTRDQALPYIFRFEYELVKAALAGDDDHLPYIDVHTPYIIDIDPHGPIDGSPFYSLDQALDAARGLEQGGVKIRSINRGGEILKGTKLRAALGKNTRREFINFPSGG